MKSSTIKVSLEDCLHLWSEYMHTIKQVSKATDNIEATLNEVKKLQSTLAEKKCQMDKVKVTHFFFSPYFKKLKECYCCVQYNSIYYIYFFETRIEMLSIIFH